MVGKYINNQFYCECQLIAIWNAAKFYGFETPEPETRQYKTICKESRCLYGGCIDVDKEKERLNISSTRGLYSFKWVKYHLPVHFRVFCHRGYHSVLVVEVDNKDVILANYARNRLHRMSWKQLKEISNRLTKPEQFIIKT